TVCGSRDNPQSFRIVLGQERLTLKNKYDIEAYWPATIFDEIFGSKAKKIILVFAESRGEKKTANERFHFKEAYILINPEINKLKSAIVGDKLKVDIRIGAYRSG